MGTKFTLTFPGASVVEVPPAVGANLSVLVQSEDNGIFNVINAYLRLDDHSVERISAAALGRLGDSVADVVITTSGERSESMASLPEVEIQPACAWSSYGSPTCPCHAARLIQPLSLKKFRENLEGCRQVRMQCEVASKHIAPAT
jgi:hypothetical protein